MAMPKSVDSASDAGLSYVMDRGSGISRVPARTGFHYYNASGKRIHDPSTLRRIQSLVIPPNWKHVWICPNPNGHLQATGRDARNRKQYRYHARYRTLREQAKYDKMILFAQNLPAIRHKVDRDLTRPGLPQQKVLATVVRLMDLSQIRVGNKEYARDNQSFGLTTMRDRHVDVEGSTIHFHFRGKSGKMHALDLRNQRLAAIVKRCRDVPGYELFQYIDENQAHVPVDSGMVNQYLRATTGRDITAKDFRTWHGTVHAAEQLCACGKWDTEVELKRNIVGAIKAVAEHLGNRPATCRKYYVHPLILEHYAAGKLNGLMTAKPKAGTLKGLGRTEQCVLQLLQHSPNSGVLSHRKRRSLAGS